MSTNDTEHEMNDAAQQVLLVENTFYQEVTIAGVNGACPYGHRVGDQFKVTAMNSDGICGSLLTSIMFPITTLHYGGAILWENDPDTARGWCHEGGKVQVEIRRRRQKERTLLKTPCRLKNMTGKGYTALDKYKVLVEVRDIAINCYWGHKIGDVFEVDPFNVGGACCLLYAQLYPYMHVLLAGTSPPWAWDEHTIMGECPDTYDRLAYRLFVQER